jgi:predicted ester cyclase
MADREATARRYADEVWNGDDLDVIDEIFSATHHYADPMLPDLPPGPEGVRQRVNTYRSAFPDCRVTLDDVSAAGDTVVARWTWGGTNTGSLMGGPPTGLHVRITGMHWLRFAGDRIDETWVQADNLGLLMQLGIVALPVPA